MSFMFFLWLLVSCVLLSFWGWTIWIVFNQKRAWRFYAKKRDLRYLSNGLMDTPTISGSIDGYTISIFASEHSELDARSQRRLTAIEVTLHSPFSFSGAIASGGMVPIVEQTNLNQEFKPDMKSWDDSYIVRSERNAIIEEYLTSERLNNLTSLMKTDKAWIAFLMLQNIGLLRLDTPLPIDNPKMMDMIVQQMIAAAKSLELKDGEEKNLLRERAKSEALSPVLDAEFDVSTSGLELEDDE